MRYDHPGGELDARIDLALLAQCVLSFFDGSSTAELLKSCTVSLSCVTDDEIAELNERWRQVDGPTDVLSFPLWEEHGGFRPPDGWQELPLGDVVIAPEFIERASRDAGRDPLRELVVIIAHGTLHLIGWDHADEASEAEMFSAQESIADEYFRRRS